MQPNDAKTWEELGIEPPVTFSHGTEEDIRSHLERVRTSNWRMEGNKLIADTQWGELVQMLPTDVMCAGTDEAGLPILKKIV